MQQFGGGEVAAFRLFVQGERNDADVAAVADHAGAVAGQVLLVGPRQARSAEGAHRAPSRASRRPLAPQVRIERGNGIVQV
jgi:hypothetical protein